MERIKLNNGVEMPVLGFGTYQITDLAECERCVAEAIGTGYRMIDTAQGYRNEEAVGAGIRKSGVAREELFVVTKVRFRNYEPEVCRASVLTSMEKLGVDYLDLLLLHWPFGNYYAAWRELEKLYAEGKIRAIGVSNFAPDRLVDLIGYNKVIPAVNQIEAHVLCQRKEDRAWMEKYKVAGMAYAPLGQARKREMFELPAVAAPAEKYGKTPAQVMLRFLIQLGMAPIPKSTHLKRIQENFDVFDFTLCDDEMEALRQLDTGIAMIGNPQDPVRAESALTWQ